MLSRDERAALETAVIVLSRYRGNALGGSALDAWRTGAVEAYGDIARTTLRAVIDIDSRITPEPPRAEPITTAERLAAPAHDQNTGGE